MGIEINFKNKNIKFRFNDKLVDTTNDIDISLSYYPFVRCYEYDESHFKICE